MKTILALVVLVLSLQGCAMYWEAVRIGNSREYRQHEREYRRDRLERDVERELRELRKRQ